MTAEGAVTLSGELERSTRERQVHAYNTCGFAIVQLLTPEQTEVIVDFAKRWIYRLLHAWTGGREELFPLEAYHTWSENLGVDHPRIFCATNRHTSPPAAIGQALLNDRVSLFLSGVGVRRFRPWDEGLGWLGFRFIRPGKGDGYPVSRKSWGVAGGVLSWWIPVIGHSSRETLALVPGSHIHEYPRGLTRGTKFRADEYRLADDVTVELWRPSLQPGEAIVYHPRPLHTEDVPAASITRLNLEFRIEPSN